jgi:uncharacterized protein (DUF169 family)
MTMISRKMAILEKFGFDVPPIGIKYLVQRPDNLPRLAANMTLCEMLKKSQEGVSFYSDAQNHTCDAGLYILGQAELKEPYLNGEFGAGLELFKNPRAAARLYQHVPRIAKGIVKYVVFEPLARMTVDPDIIIILANTSQAEILLRASSYETGKMWISRYTPAIGCAWLFSYPYISGEMNQATTGLGFGMRRRKLFQEGQQFLTIPFDILPSLLETLLEMPWIPAPYQQNGLEFVKQLRIRLGLDRA